MSKKKIIIAVEGGLVQDVLLPKEYHDDFDIFVVDFDCDEDDNDHSVEFFSNFDESQGLKTTSLAWVSEIGPGDSECDNDCNRAIAQFQERNDL